MAIDASATEQILISDLMERCQESAFVGHFGHDGSFYKAEVSGRSYFYFQSRQIMGRRNRKYVGPADDPEIAKLVDNHNKLKIDARHQADIVRLLRNSGFPRPTPDEDAVISAMESAGLFRLRGLVVGSVAFQAYATYLGAKLPGAALRTGDIDFAQDHGISMALDDKIDDIQEVLLQIDPSFRPLPSLRSNTLSFAYRNDRGYKVEFLTTNRGADEVSDKLQPLPALGTGAAPLRYLDFLIRNPVRSVLLTRSGTMISIPAPERYALHKMIIAPMRMDRLKKVKDQEQARTLIQLLERRGEMSGLADAFEEGYARGPNWKAHFAEGLEKLDEATKYLIRRAIKDRDIDI